jgi:N-formylglutamate amidohydrolase
MILHIPHSSTKIPDYEIDMMQDKSVLEAIEKYTDHRTDELFNYWGADRIQYPYSRVFCDVEKLEENEPMEALGLGILYDVSSATRKYPSRALETYKEHHTKLLNNVSSLKTMLNKVVIIDCHSFSDEQAKEQGFDSSTIDICLGTDEIHTPNELTTMSKEHFEKEGYRVGINTPFEGTIIPLKLYGDEDVISIMIEVNKRVYEGSNSNDEDFNKLKNCITSLLEKINIKYS